MTAPAPSPDVQPSRHWLMLMVAAPAAIATMVVLLFMCMELAGHTPSAIQATTIAEAAGMGNGAEVLRRMQLGEDPTRVQLVRPEIIGDALTHVTAVEAAVFSRRVQLVQLLDERGAIVGADMRLFLACLAQEIKIGEIVEYLAPGGPPACEPGAARARIVARTGLSE